MCVCARVCAPARPDARLDFWEAGERRRGEARRGEGSFSPRQARMLGVRFRRVTERKSNGSMHVSIDLALSFGPCKAGQ